MQQRSGNYWIKKYDKYSSKTETVEAPNLIGAISIGKKAVVDPDDPCTSFVVIRILYNSLEHGEK